jgi:hypothetical protein
MPPELTKSNPEVEAVFQTIKDLSASVLPSTQPARETRYVLSSNDLQQKIEFRAMPTSALPWDRAKELQAVLATATTAAPLRLRLVRDQFKWMREVAMSPEHAAIIQQCLSALSPAPQPTAPASQAVEAPELAI